MKMQKPLAYVAGSGCEDSLSLLLLDSVYKAHLALKGSSTALIKIVGNVVPVVAIEGLMARIFPLNSQ
jgi:hypothetical protein